MNIFRYTFCLVICILPWPVKRLVLNYFFGYSLCKTSYIGLSWIFPKYLKMMENAKIATGNVCLHLDRLIMLHDSSIARGNWITGYPKSNDDHFSHIVDRDPSLYIGEHSSITKKHHFDCTESIRIGSFTTIAGYGSQFLTHSINIKLAIQDAKPISIGDFCFIGTSSTFLGGSMLSNGCVVGANSLVNKAHKESFCLIAGSPAVLVKKMSANFKYFTRTKGYID